MVFDYEKDFPGIDTVAISTGVSGLTDSRDRGYIQVRLGQLDEDESVKTLDTPLWLKS